jgi:hypothetical protein
LTYTVPAGSTHAAAGGNYTTANASFGGNVKTTCVPNPSLGTACPALMVLVRPFTESFCSFTIDPPPGQALVAGTNYRAQRLASAGIAGFDMNCAKGGTTCNWSVGNFRLHELTSNSAGIVTRLHVTFEQTCSNLDGSLYGAGTATGELWIVDGTKGYFDALS